MTSSMYHSPDWKMGKREKRNLGEECQLFVSWSSTPGDASSQRMTDSFTEDREFIMTLFSTLKKNGCHDYHQVSFGALLCTLGWLMQPTTS